MESIIRLNVRRPSPFSVYDKSLIVKTFLPTFVDTPLLKSVFYSILTNIVKVGVVKGDDSRWIYTYNDNLKETKNTCWMKMEGGLAKELKSL